MDLTLSITKRADNNWDIAIITQTVSKSLNMTTPDAVALIKETMEKHTLPHEKLVEQEQ